MNKSIELAIIMTHYFMPFFWMILAFFPLFGFAETKYISDHLSVYTRNGPGLQYPLAGSLTSGDKVEVLEVSKDGKFARIQHSENHTSWIEIMVLQEFPPAQLRLHELKSELALLRDKFNTLKHTHENNLRQLREKLTASESSLEKMTQIKHELHTENADHKKVIKNLKNQVIKNYHDINFDWFLYGGIVAGGGVLLGLLLPRIMPRRRKYDSWID